MGKHRDQYQGKDAPYLSSCHTVVLEVLEIRSEEPIRGMSFGKEDSKLPWFAHNMVIYWEGPRESQ